MVRVRIRVMVC